MKTAHYYRLLVVLAGISTTLAAVERPSLGKHAKQIAELEVKTVVIESAVLENKTSMAEQAVLIGTNTKNLAEVTGKEGPQGPEGQVGPQGPAGPAGTAGKDHPLNELECKLGQVATWNSSQWVCSEQQSPNYPPVDGRCATGFFFSVDAQTVGNDEKWNVICDKASSAASIWGPFTESSDSNGFFYSPSALQAQNVPSVSLQLFSSYGSMDNIVQVEFAPISLGNNQGLSLSIISHENGLNDKIIQWANSGSSDWTFAFQESISGTRIEFSRCQALELKIKPVRFEAEVLTEHYVELNCNKVEAIEVFAHPLVVTLLLNHFAQAEGVLPDSFTLRFDPVEDVDMSQFDRAFEIVQFLQYQLPSVTQAGEFQEQLVWQLGPHSLEFDGQASNINLAQ
jgi:hypothetical protein